MIVHQRGNRNRDWLGNNHNKIMKDTGNTCARHNGVQVDQLKYDPYPILQYLQTLP
jgi:hypothetical protein